jgi:hypothetical protein
MRFVLVTALLSTSALAGDVSSSITSLTKPSHKRDYLENRTK